MNHYDGHGSPADDDCRDRLTMTITDRDALIVVDVQNDFCPGGALEVAEGDRIVPRINRIAPLFAHCLYTRDWHPATHCSFAENPGYVDGSWPVHCIADTEGAAFHFALAIPDNATVIDKGTDASEEAYSGFQGTQLTEVLRAMAIQRVFVCGLATDYCVKHTALDALKAGFETTVLEDACRAVDNPEGTGSRALDELCKAGASVVSSENLVR